jgi:hypothetical protein
MRKSQVKTLLTIPKEFLPEDQIVNSDYLGVLNRLWVRILRIRPEYREQGTWSHLHNAPPHKLKIMRDFFDRTFSRFGSSRFLVVPKVKLAMKGDRHDTIHDIQRECTAVLNSIPQKEYSDCFQKLFNPFQLCIDIEGDYF